MRKLINKLLDSSTIALMVMLATVSIVSVMSQWAKGNSQPPVQQMSYDNSLAQNQTTHSQGHT